MPPSRIGLQKKIASIFSGIPVRSEEDTDSKPEKPTAENPNYGPPSHLTPAKLKPDQPPATPAKIKPTTDPKPKEPETKQPPVKEPRLRETRLKEPKIKPRKPGPARKTQTQAKWQQLAEQISKKLFAPKPGASPAKQKAMVLLVPVLVVVMIVIFTQVLDTPTRAPAAPAHLGLTGAASGDINWKIPEPYPKTLRDPMELGSATGPQLQTSELIVKGIVYSDDNPSAVIGERIVHEGDKIGDTTVVKISKNSVDFEKNGKTWNQKVQR